MKEKINIQEVYNILLSHYSPQGWWPILDKGYSKDNKTRTLTDSERFEISIGAILTQYRHFSY